MMTSILAKSAMEKTLRQEVLEHAQHLSNGELQQHIDDLLALILAGPTDDAVADEILKAKTALYAEVRGRRG